MKKYFAILSLIISTQVFTQNQLYIQHKENGQLVKVKLNSNIRYVLHSDSVMDIGKEVYDHDKLQWVGDSSFFLPSGEEVSFTDVKKIRVHKPVHAFMKKISIPLVCAGAPFLLQGLTKFQLEGMERENEDYIPLAVGAGGTLTLLGVLPLAIPPKEYDLTSGEWELISTK